MNQHGNLWPLIGVHSQVLAEVLDTAERWLVQGESQKSGNFSFYSTLLLSTDYSFIIIQRFYGPSHFNDHSIPSPYWSPRKQPYSPRICHKIGKIGLNPSNVKIWYLRIDWRIFPVSGLSILTDTRSIEVHKERGQRHMSYI